jgi:signal transduction histidine kinase
MDEVTRILIFTTVFTLSTAILLLISFSVNRRRRQQYKKQLLEQEFKTREDALLQVSRDLHDDIGSSLSGINMLCQLAQQQLVELNYGAANELLQKINTYNNEVVEKVSDMAWLLKPNQESLFILIKKLKAYCLSATSSKNICLHFDSGPEISEKELTIQQRKTVYLISKEAINNAVKYSGCKNIYYSIYSDDNKMKLFISDDGNGFSVSEINNGNGLTNMKTRAAEIGASFNIQSEPGQTNITVTI